MRHGASETVTGRHGVPGTVTVSHGASETVIGRHAALVGGIQEDAGSPLHPDPARWHAQDAVCGRAPLVLALQDDKSRDAPAIP